MKNQASAKEERREARNLNIVSHGEFNLKCHSLWFIFWYKISKSIDSLFQPLKIVPKLLPKAIFLFVGIISFLSAYCSAKDAPGVLLRTGFTHGEVRRASLDNGMVVLLKENRSLPLVSLFLCVSLGSAQEGKFAGSGISHFIEHMVFKGTAQRAVGDVFREIESYGGKINAFTSYDYTGYRITVPSEFVSFALGVLADIVMNATFDEQELEKEREVVLQEIRLNYDDPQRYVSRLLWQTAYSTHPYKYPIIGREPLFKSLDREDLIKFYQARYLPNNMVLAIVGDIQTEKALSSVRGHFKDFPRKPILGLESKSEPEQKELRRQEEEFTAGLTYLRLGFHSVALTGEDIFALDVLAAVLGEGKDSRLYKLICNKKGLAYSLEAINYTPREPGLFIISSLLEERHRKRVQSLILDQIKLLQKKAIAKDELESAKNKIISNVLFYNQTIEAQAQDLALNEVLAGNFRFTEKYVQKIREVTAQDILGVASKYLKQNNLSIVALTPRDKSVKSNTPMSPSKHFRLGVENLTRGSVESASIQRYVLDNGLTLLVRENKDLPLISLKAVFKGGLRAEDEDTNGLSNLLATMLDKGTKTKNAAKIAHLVESKGARLSSFSGNNSFGLSLDLLSKDFDQLLSLLADLIINSTFPQSEFKRQKEKSLAQLKTQEDDIFESGMKLLKLTLFQKHPYRFLTAGNEKSLKKLRRRDLIKFYRNLCVGKNTVLAVFGDVDAQEVLLKVKKHFAKLIPGEAPRFATIAEPKIKTVRSSAKYLQKEQSLLLLGFPGTTVFNQDRYVLEVITQVLSQASGRLFTAIREKTGLAYTLGAYQVLGLDPGYLVIYTATTLDNVETVKKEILRQLTLLKQKPFNEKELAQAKRALVGRKLISRQTNAACALESALDELYGLGFNRYLKYSEMIKQVEATDILQVANKYFDLDSYAVVVVRP